MTFVEQDRANVAATSANAQDPWHRHPVTLTTALILLLGGAFLNARSIELDESISAGLGRGSWSAWYTGVAEDGGSQSLYFLLVRVFGFLGDDPWVIRLPALIGAAMVPYPMWRLIEPLAGRGVATRAMLIVAVSYSFITNAQEARAYTVLAAVIVWSWFMLVRAIETRSLTPWIVYGFLVALSLYAQPLGVPILAAQGVWLLLHRRDVHWGHVAVGGSVAGVLALPFVYLTLFEAVDHTQWLGTFTVSRFAEHVTAAFGLQRLGESVPLGVAATVTAMLLAAVGAWPWGVEAERYRRTRLLFVLWAVVPVVILVAGSMSRAYFSARYAVPLVPATATLAALGIERLADIDARLGRLAFVAVIGLLGARTLTGYAGEPVPWDELQQSIASRATPADMIAFEPAYVQAPFEYYTWLNGDADTMARPMPPSIGWTAPRHPNTEEYPQTLVTPPEGDLWVVVRTSTGADSVPAIVDRIGVDMVEVERVEFGESIVLRFSRAGQ